MNSPSKRSRFIAFSRSLPGSGRGCRSFRQEEEPRQREPRRKCSPHHGEAPAREAPPLPPPPYTRRRRHRPRPLEGQPLPRHGPWMKHCPRDGRTQRGAGRWPSRRAGLLCGKSPRGGGRHPSLVHAKRGLSNAACRSRGAGTCEADVSGCVGLATRVQTWPSQTAGSGEGRRPAGMRAGRGPRAGSLEPGPRASWPAVAGRKVVADTTRSEAEEGCGQERPGCRHRGPEVQGAGRRGGPVRRGEARRRPSGVARACFWFAELGGGSARFRF